MERNQMVNNYMLFGLKTCRLLCGAEVRFYVPER